MRRYLFTPPPLPRSYALMARQRQHFLLQVISPAYDVGIRSKFFRASQHRGTDVGAVVDILVQENISGSRPWDDHPSPGKVFRLEGSWLVS